MKSLNRKEISKAKLNLFNVRGERSLKKGVPIFDFSILFIEVWCLENKLAWIRYELGQIIIPKNSKRMCFILIRTFLGQALKLCQSALGKC